MLRTPAFFGGWARGRAAMRWALAWFVLSLGVAIASPIVHPKVVEWVCSSVGSVTAVVRTEAGMEEAGAVHADCPLCVLTGPPAHPPTLALPALLPLSRAVQSIPAARIAAATAAPLPARGPPRLS
ncbi:hypothetical protein [Acidovorax sp. SUPP3334]|uniref:hypothetical protein n=1 Tax=Acidovorax sp. SUPP3334 TaxID=2920881 RepID=UPI0024E183E8|nr:hypothetical protein [Acidovorax sp. SUPP3334]